MHALREIRLRLGLSTCDFSQAIGWKPTTLNIVENGKHKVSDRMVVNMAAALGLSLEDARTLANGEHPDCEVKIPFSS